jgi:Na+/proline symporter
MIPQTRVFLYNPDTMNPTTPDLSLNAMDWSIVAAYFAVSLAIALWYSRRASQGTEDFFLSGRGLPWWLAGTSMVATTFAADTPLAVTELVAKHGIAGNWLWWSQAFGTVLTVFFFAKLWRRAGVMTDVEFAELRYSGKPAACLRAFRAVYLALPVNLIIMGWVNLAMSTVLSVSLDMDRMTAVWFCFGITALYTVLSGFWGVVVTDLFQFVFAMTGCIILAAVAVNSLGGLHGMLDQVSLTSPLGAQTLSLFPSHDAAWMPWSTFLVYVGMAWWASWYPGAEPGGGGYVAQRIFAAKNERHAVGAALWFAIAHYALRPWPWILVALASVVMFPGLAKPGEGFPKVMMAVLPSPWKGFLIAAFAAAYMSTLSTHLNWGASYLVNDVYRRFLRPDKDDRHYVWIARLASLALAALSFLVTGWMDSVSEAWMFLIAVGAGCGAVYILRLYWWRINAWSEISAMLGAPMIALSLPYITGWSREDPGQYGWLMLLTTLGTTAVWLTVTLLTKPEPDAVLDSFYRKVAPAPEGWGAVARRVHPDSLAHAPLSLKRSALSWALGCLCIYASLFAIGQLLLGHALGAGLLAAAGAGALFLLLKTL